ncbi:Uncharacterised protein [uncultured archaeon]|nr:Uncharacterised protein [uncultured archaeon]
MTRTNWMSTRAGIRRSNGVIFAPMKMPIPRRIANSIAEEMRAERHELKTRICRGK